MFAIITAISYSLIAAIKSTYHSTFELSIFSTNLTTFDTSNLSAQCVTFKATNETTV